MKDTRGTFLPWSLPRWLGKIKKGKKDPSKLWTGINQRIHIFKMSIENSKLSTSWPWWSTVCGMAFIDFMYKRAFIYQGLPYSLPPFLFLCHSLYFQSTPVLSLPCFVIHSFSVSLFLPPLFCLLPSVSFLLLFYYLNVLPCSLHFLFAILLTGHNMGLQSIFKHMFTTFPTSCSEHGNQVMFVYFTPFIHSLIHSAIFGALTFCQKLDTRGKKSSMIWCLSFRS